MKAFGDSPEILVIDDLIDAATSFAELINLKYKFHTISVSNKDDALDAVRIYNIKVAVIDQVMPDIMGTDLFKLIKKISPEINAIMLTGEASVSDVGLAINNGFKKYLNKGDIKLLPEAVLDQYIDYEKNIIKKNQIGNKKSLFTENKYILFPNIKYFLTSILKINNEYIFQDQWKTLSSINVGEEKEIEEVNSYEDKIIITNEVESKTKAELNINSKSFPLLKSSINKELTQKYKSVYEVSKSTTTRNKTIFKLPKQPDDITEKHIIKRDIEIASIYVEYRVLIEKYCVFCNHSQIYPMTIYKQTRKNATKQIDYYSDGTRKETDTGIQKN